VKPETLHDKFYRATFRNETCPGWRSNSDMRRAFESARRFVADERMSRFMADLANEAFISTKGDYRAVRRRITESLRVQSRLPHEGIWIEYNFFAYATRLAELLNTPPGDPNIIPHIEGWLIQQHPKIDTACIMHLFLDETLPQSGYVGWTFPMAFAWCCDNSPLPWHSILDNEITDADHGLAMPSEWLTSVGGFRCKNVNCVQSPLLLDPLESQKQKYLDLLNDWKGALRKVWALLATIDNLPLTFGQTRQTKGFLARGRIRKFLDHTTITLNVPAKKDTRVLARNVIAIAHRKRHEVRGHWRDDWRNPPGKHCNPHLWECVDDDADLIECEQCHGRQIYIHKHERGDAALGYVTHDYALKHPEIQ